MSHGRKPRRSRWPAGDGTFKAAAVRVAKLSQEEVALLLGPVQTGFAALREGRAKATDWLELACAVTMALAIEEQGVVKGLKVHLDNADNKLSTIADRAALSDGWHTPTLYAAEIEAIDTLIDLFKFQLGQLSGAEFARAHRASLSKNVQLGGTVGEASRRSMSKLSIHENAMRQSA